MNKPSSMSIKEYLVRLQAMSSLRSESVINSVITHQFQSANDAMKTNNSIEISGFGKFYFNLPKAKKRIEALNNKIRNYKRALIEDSPSEILIKRIEARIVFLQEELDRLNNKTNEL
jgi:nucleoid DNA-binding protein